MKKAKLIMTTLLCGFLFTTSCDKGDDWQSTDGPYPRDKTLAGSVDIQGQNIIEAQGEYNDNQLDNFKPKLSILSAGKESDTEINLFCMTTWGETEFKISIPKIPLLGVPYDVTFDCKSDVVAVTHNDTKYNHVSTTVKGWIKGKDKSLSKNDKKDIAPIPYDCDINITCTIDGKALNLKITSINP